jgi:hypothetical protein
MTFLQLEEVCTCRSVLYAGQFAGMTKEERIHATTYTETEPEVDNTKHVVDPNLVTNLEEEMKVWGYLMTQYNLKPGLRKFEAKGMSRELNRYDAAINVL